MARILSVDQIADPKLFAETLIARIGDFADSPDRSECVQKGEWHQDPPRDSESDRGTRWRSAMQDFKTRRKHARLVLCVSFDAGYPPWTYQALPHESMKLIFGHFTHLVRKR